MVAEWARRLGPSGVATLSLSIEEARERLQRFVNGRLVLDAFVERLAKELNGGNTHAAV